MALRDSKVNVQIGTATQRDSAAMRTISLVTMAFLPATFVSVSDESEAKDPFTELATFQTIFSMSFFSFSPNSRSNGQVWTVSDKIWIYWVFAGPLTVATLILWFVRERGWKNLLVTLRFLGLGE